ncbi:hypothetical protein LLS47_01920 [Rouxiella badensis]|uniref:hypothetical protein n=2 Tax=Rouxiella badensis TaxID=1646377 RepID=UPI001D1513EF|nr:hypothetical protein [Rouxiella badensis]MCC3731694.1 hypothetical protein [Rouxiella badensis]MCC3738629.1 hypothetical protein [Rouxiella badensis]MCC3757083.1 hypothetical protein [Rouxiella badensis]
MPPTNQAICSSTAPQHVPHLTDSTASPGIASRCVEWARNTALLPTSFSCPPSLSALAWRMGDGAFRLAVSFLRQFEQRTEWQDCAEMDAVEHPLLASLNHFLWQQGYGLPALPLLGPATAFCSVYYAASLALGHAAMAENDDVFHQTLAAYLAGACGLSCDVFATSSDRQTPTWESDCSILETDLEAGSSFDEIYLLGLPATEPLYGATGSRRYTLDPASSALFIGQVRTSPMNFCSAQIPLNQTSIASGLAGVQMAVHLADQQNRAIYAISTGEHAVAVDTSPLAASVLSLPSFGLSDPLVFPTAQSADISVNLPPWRQLEGHSTSKTVHKRGVIHDGPLALMKGRYKEPSGFLPRPNAPAQQEPSQASLREAQLYGLKINAEDGRRYPLFAPPTSQIDCLSCLPEPLPPVKARSLLEMIEKVYFWVEGLSSQSKQRVIEQYIHRQPAAVSSDSHNKALEAIVAACGLLMIHEPTHDRWHSSSAEVQMLFSLLLMQSPFAHNEELKIVLAASPAGEAILAKLLLDQLDAYLSPSSQLIKASHQHVRGVMTQPEPVTYGRLEACLKDIQDAFITRVFSSLKGTLGLQQDDLSAEKVSKIAQWHLRLIEFDYPFMLLRDLTPVKGMPCLSSTGLLMNIGVRRVQDRQKMSMLTPRDLTSLGEDLLLNNVPEALIRDFSHLEALHKAAGAGTMSGIEDAANKLKRKSVLLIQYSEAKRRLTEVLKAPGEDAPSIAAFKYYRDTQQRLYALALESISGVDRARMLVNLHRMHGITLQFIQMEDTQGNSSLSRPHIGFLLSSEGNINRAGTQVEPRHYFISLIPAQSDTTQPLVFPVHSTLPDELLQPFSTQGKKEFLARLFDDATVNDSRYQFYLQNEGSLHSAVQITDWRNVADSLANSIIARQYSAIAMPAIAPMRHAVVTESSESQGPVSSWFRYLLSQLIYLTPIGNCKDAAEDLIKADLAPLVLDGAFCLYAFAPGASEEEQGIKSVANIIKNVLKKTLEDNIAVSEQEPVLTRLDKTLQEVECQLKPHNQAIDRVRYHLCGNRGLRPWLLFSALNNALVIGEIPDEYKPTLAWREPFHDVLYFILATPGGQRAYRFDELNQLLLPNPSSSLLTLMAREAHIDALPVLEETLSTGNTHRLRTEIYQHERMRHVAYYGVCNCETLDSQYEVVAQQTALGTYFFPGIKVPATDNQYRLVPSGMPEDQQLVVEKNNGILRYLSDNVIYFKTSSTASQFIASSDAAENLLNNLQNIPNGWTMKALWIEQGAGERIVVDWQDTAGNSHLRHPDRQGKWLIWESHHRGIFCQHLSRVRRNDSPDTSRVAGLFSPEHCGYLEVPKINSPGRAAALNVLTQRAKKLAGPIVFEKINCADLAKNICAEFEDIWDTIPDSIRKVITDIRDWRIDVKVFNEFGRFTNALADYSYALNNVEPLTHDDKRVKNRFCQKVLNLIKEYEKLKLSVLESKRLKEEFRDAKKDYYDTYIARNLKANNWLNRWFQRVKFTDKTLGNYIVKATTPEQIVRDYEFLYQGIQGAMTQLNHMAESISARLSESSAAGFLSGALKDFFNADFTPPQVDDFREKISRYLHKIGGFNISQVVVVADRLSEGRLASGCYDTPIEKLIYGDGAFSFVYNSESDKHIYILDYLSNQQFIEYALAHELGHLTFDESKYAFSEEIYLKANTVVKNFNVSGASKFARHLMSDKGFFLDYIAKYDSFGAAFYRHFFAHTRNPHHRRALRNYHALFLDRSSIGSLYSNDAKLRKRELAPVVDYFFSVPDIQLNIAYYNPDIFCGLFNFIYERALGIVNQEAEERRRKKRQSGESSKQDNKEFFKTLLFSALYEKHLQDNDAHLAHQ